MGNRLRQRRSRLGSGGAFARKHPRCAGVGAPAHCWGLGGCSGELVELVLEDATAADGGDEFGGALDQ